MASVRVEQSSPIKSARAFLYGDMPKITYGTRSPVFIIGAPRSGTSILVRLIRKYFHINFGTESQFIVHYYKRLDKLGNLSNPRNMDRLISHVAQERCFVRWKKQCGFSLDLDLLKREIQAPTFRGLLDAIFGQFARFAGRIRWGDKYPEYTLDLPVLEALYPEAQYIHIIRDGRDVALSLQYTDFGPKNFMQAGFYWKQYVTLARNFGQRLCSTRFREIRYEALLRDPIHLMTDLARFLQVDEGFQEAINRIKQQIHEDLKKDNALKWKNALLPSQVGLFEKGAGNLLQILGYEGVAANRKPPTLIERATSSIDNVIRCYTNRSYVRTKLYELQRKFRRP